ncbi:hypothetical protein HanHA300_Chr14g0519591 [Helianthus annuus]|nr:hypothetical protein HanHA300_Chr14g0519591 [Helianthus annuus]KAJ0468064.1 hypothetical protein HanIR_Chr14g0692301 [Helianthus annuus]KAJ0485295.1 hypothetical protein HanHA89_Chr14g0566611 [Helianthus annuus]KAJ0655839.1 hypothetical protein HanLR1_Chr14g0528881 [Helianthus annuus]
MKHNLNANEVKHVLYDKIDKRSFPEAIWQEFEQQKQELFDNYSRLIMKELHIKQPEVMNQSNTPPGKIDKSYKIDIWFYLLGGRGAHHSPHVKEEKEA